jgi:uncharacterized protein YjbI with pentapeptide repeats/beta-lactamase regulating signal transducer with metallopeptidase domain
MQPSLFEVIARAVIVVLVNSLWQGIAIAALTWLALRLFPRVNASTRYVAWTLALVAVVVVPIATSLTHISYYTLPPATQTTQAAAANVQQPAAQVNAVGGASRSELKHGTASGARHSDGGSLRSLTIPKVPDLHVNVPMLLLTIFFTLWGIAALLLVVRLAVALLRLERLKHDAMPLGIEYRDQLQQWQRLDPDGDVRICVTGGIEVPVAVGLFDAMVLLPKDLLDQFDAQEIDQISLHEFAHLLRHDDWTNGLQRVITALFFFNPAVWFIARQMDVEREVACDDYVLELTGAVRTYAFALTKMAEKTSWPHQPLAAPGVFTTRKNISIRIERLLRSGRAIGSSISPATAGAVAIGLLGGYFVASSLTPVVAFAMPCPTTAAPAPTTATSALEREPKASEPPFAATAPKMPVSLPQTVLTVPNIVVTTAPMHITASINAERAARLAARAEAAKATAKAELDADTAKALAAMKKSVAYDASIASAEAAKKTAEALVGKVPVKIASSGNMNCSGCDFSGQDLSGKNFAGSNFTGSDFSKANLRSANFDGANLSGSDFENADLRYASFVGANLSGANLDGAKLDGTNLDDANLSGADLNPRRMSQAQIRAYLPHCRGCDLEGADLSGMDLSGVKLTGVDLSKANLRGANLSNATFSGVDFSGADLRGARTDGTQFIGCDFSGAQLGNR